MHTEKFQEAAAQIKKQLKRKVRSVDQDALDVQTNTLMIVSLVLIHELLKKVKQSPEFAIQMIDYSLSIKQNKVKVPHRTNNFLEFNVKNCIQILEENFEIENAKNAIKNLCTGWQDIIDTFSDYDQSQLFDKIIQNQRFAFNVTDLLQEIFISEEDTLKIDEENEEYEIEMDQQASRNQQSTQGQGDNNSYKKFQFKFLDQNNQSQFRQNQQNNQFINTQKQIGQKLKLQQINPIDKKVTDSIPLGYQQIDSDLPEIPSQIQQNPQTVLGNQKQKPPQIVFNWKPLPKPDVQTQVFKAFTFSATRKRDLDSNISIQFGDNTHVNSLDFLNKQYKEVFNQDNSKVLSSVSNYSSGNTNEEIKILQAIDTHVIQPIKKTVFEKVLSSETYFLGTLSKSKPLVEQLEVQSDGSINKIANKEDFVYRVQQNIQQETQKDPQLLEKIYNELNNISPIVKLNKLLKVSNKKLTFQISSRYASQSELLNTLKGLFTGKSVELTIDKGQTDNHRLKKPGLNQTQHPKDLKLKHKPKKKLKDKGSFKKKA